MKSTAKNIIIGVLIVAVIISLVWRLPPRLLFAILLILQIITLLAIGGTNLNISNNGNRADVNGNGNEINNTEHGNEEKKASYTGEEEA